MKAIELKISDEVYQKLEDLASHDHQQVDVFALRKLEELVRAVEKFAELEHRAQRGQHGEVPGGDGPGTNRATGAR